MTLIVEPQPIPLRKEPDGSWRVGNSRVLFSLVVSAFNNGRTPEEIVQSYDTLSLEEVYAVLAYYLAHRKDVDAFLSQQEAEADEFQEQIESREDYKMLRQRLLSHRVVISTGALH